jgi:hypothetical protein
MVGVREEAAKLGSIDMREYDSGVINEKDVVRAAPLFVGTINAVLDVMRLQDSKVAAKAKMKEMAAKRTASQAASSTTGSTPTSSASAAIVYVPPSSGSTSASFSSTSTITRKRNVPEPIVLGPMVKRNRQGPSPPVSPPDPKTPDQPTQLPNPDLSHGSTATNISGNTVELKDEETTKVLMNRFITDSLTILSIEF